MDQRDETTDQAEPDPPVRRYANHLSVHVSLSEVELRFGDHASSGDTPQIHSLVVSSPLHLVTFGRAIQAGIDGYETQFGRLPDGTE